MTSETRTGGKANQGEVFLEGWDDSDALLNVVILGSTGSIGTQALEVIARHPRRFVVRGLAAGGANLELLAEQTRRFRPEVVAVARELREADLRSPDTPEGVLRKAASSVGAELLTGAGAPEELAGRFPSATVLNGVTGGIGLAATLRALEAGSRLALANKESLVVGGAVVTRAVRYPGQIVPVDSEHSAIAQALLTGVHEKGVVSPVLTGRSELHSLVLTASGGPFRGKRRSELLNVTAEEALAHPTWAMGPVVTVNSSTLMNKGLELIEASLLFDVPPAQITPVVHPQSIVHSMVTWKDGSTLAQASYPDMQVPIALGLDWHAHLDHIGRPLEWSEASAWTFEPVDHETFPALTLARDALAASGTHPAVLNAANEVCVEAFLTGRISWVQILDTVAATLEEHGGCAEPTLEDVVGAQEWATARARELLGIEREDSGSH